MALDGVDQEILEDFLVEAGEIIDNLATQLVDLEKTPEDKDLLNSIFRGFHTVKGGAGFLGLTDLVNVCHGAESVFDALRKDTCKVSPALMDVVLQAYDCICNMFTQLKEGNMPVIPYPDIIDRLHGIVEGGNAETASSQASSENKTPEATSEPAQPEIILAENPSAKDHEFSDDDFENLLNSLQGGDTEVPSSGSSDTTKTENKPTETTVQAADSSSHEFTDDDFEALLDSLNGGEAPLGNDAQDAVKASGNGHEVKDPVDDDFEAMLASAEAKPISIPELRNLDREPMTISAKEAPKAQNGDSKNESAPVSKKESADSGASTDFSDDDFENLLDSLYGKNGDPSAGQGTEKTSSVSAPAVKPAAPALEQKSKAEIKAASTPVLKPEEKKGSSGTPVKSTSSAVKTEQSKTADDKNHEPHAVGGSGAVADTTVRVDVKIMDDIMNMVGELVLVRNRLLSLGGAHDNLLAHYEEVQKAIANLNLITGDIQGLVMKTRMQPIKRVFSRFPRVVRDLARNLNKEIELVTEGEETDLDKNLVDSLADLMIHLVRNSCDHGIEPPDVRVKAGKPRLGRITLSASQQGDHVLLKVIDDGYGMDPEVIKKTAIKQGILDPERAKTMTAEESYNLIFAPGFSTKSSVSDISGRGVGMDVVKTNIAKLNGSFTIYSRKGSGTTIEIKVPLTLAILPTMMVMVGNQNFALPLSSINEIFYLKLDDVNNLDGQKTIVIREKAYPLFYLQDWLIRDKSKVTHPSEAPVIMVHSAGGADNLVAFVVDDLIGQEEVVIKPLDVLLRGVPGIAGSAITSQGGISLIIDIPGLLRSYAGKFVNNMYRAKLA